MIIIYSFGSFTFDGSAISWSKDVQRKDIEEFSSLHKTKQSRGAEQAQEKRKYTALYQAIDAEQQKYMIRSARIVLIPMVCDISDSSQIEFLKHLKMAVESSLPFLRGFTGFFHTFCLENESPPKAFLRFTCPQEF